MSKYPRKKWGPKWLHCIYRGASKKGDPTTYDYEINPFRLFVLDLARHADGHRRITLGLGNVDGKSIVMELIWRDVLAEHDYYWPRAVN